jgi:prepilin-type N-terminal cleavage/methylation domain-containing protein
MVQNECAQRTGSARARERGFTVIELLVCLAVIALLIALLAPALAKARHRAQDAACLARLHELSLCAVVYADAYKGLPVWDTVSAVTVFDAAPATWWCAADREREIAKRSSSYAYLGLLYMGPNADITRPQTIQAWRALRAYEDNPYLPLARDMQPWHGYRNMVFWNGAATMLDER